MVATRWSATTAINAVVYGRRYVRSSLISILAPSYGLPGAGKQCSAIDPGDSERAGHGSELGFEDAGKEIGPAQPRSTATVARPDQGAPHGHLRRGPERRLAGELSRLAALRVRGCHADKCQGLATLFLQGVSQPRVIQAESFRPPACSRAGYWRGGRGNVSKSICLVRACKPGLLNWGRTLGGSAISPPPAPAYGR